MIRKKQISLLSIFLMLIILLIGLPAAYGEEASTLKPPAIVTAPPSNAEPINLVWEGAWSPKHKTYLMADHLMKMINAASGGRIKVDLHSLEPVPIREAMVALGKGTLDVLTAVPTYYSGQLGLADILLMPMNFKSIDDMFDILYNTEVAEILDKAYAEKTNTKLLWYPLMGRYSFIVSKKAKKMKTIADFDGKKVGGSGGASLETIRLLGAHNVTATGVNIYEVMNQGILDARALALYTLETYSLWETSHEVIMPPIIPAATAATWMNLDKWNKLPADIQKMFIDITRSKEFIDWQKAIVREYEETILAKAQKDYGVEVYTLPKAEQDKLWSTVSPVWDWWIKYCTKQGYGDEAKKIRDIMLPRFQK